MIVHQNLSQLISVLEIVPKIAPKIVPKIDTKIIQKNKYLKQGLHVIVRQNFSQFIGLIDVWFIIKKVDNVQNIFELLASISWGISENINKSFKYESNVVPKIVPNIVPKIVSKKTDNV